MSTTDPRFYWYPEPAGSLYEIDMGRRPTILEEIQTQRAQDAYNGMGAFTRIAGAGGMRVRIVFNRMPLYQAAYATLERQLMALEKFLQLGGGVGFSLNHSKSLAHYPLGLWSQQAQGIYVSGNAFSTWSSSAAWASGDELVVESIDPGGVREVHATTGQTGQQLTLSSSRLYWHYADRLAWVRYRHFWPVLRLPQDQLGKPLVTTENRRLVTFDATLEVDHTQLILVGAEKDGTSALELADNTPTEIGQIFKNPLIAASQPHYSGQTRFQTLVATTQLTRFLP